MRVLVCGSRTWYNKKSIRSVLFALLINKKIDVLIEGEAKGADTLAKDLAEELGISILKFPADWNKFGKAAGPIRNKRMLEEGKPDIVLAFSSDISKSKGTKNMVEIARKAGVLTYVFSK